MTSDSVPSFFLSPLTRSPVCPCLSESPQWAPIMKPSLTAPRLRASPPPPQNHLPAGIKPCTAARTQASARGGQGHIVALDCGAPCVGWRFTSNTRSIDAGWKDNGWKGLVMHAIQRHLIFTCFLFLLCTQKKNVNAPRESACHPKWGCN